MHLQPLFIAPTSTILAYTALTSPDLPQEFFVARGFPVARACSSSPVGIIFAKIFSLACSTQFLFGFLREWFSFIPPRLAFQRSTNFFTRFLRKNMPQGRSLSLAGCADFCTSFWRLRWICSHVAMAHTARHRTINLPSSLAISYSNVGLFTHKTNARSFGHFQYLVNDRF